ncbi:MAG: hypothetical protein SGI77_11930 [Pirellulaceae bacterium]|nr:hypothetical protein [Pirellulaceae bacterium]
MIVAFPHAPGRPIQITGLCDSEESHNDLWPEAAMQFDVGIDDEYFSIPRGRVLWNPVKLQSIIYHGNRTSAARLKEIATIFKLTVWTTRTDIHYMMGNAADRLFDD